MLKGSIVIYGREGHLSHILADCPGRFMEPGTDLDLVEFDGILRRVMRADISPARLWWHKGCGKWIGPHTSYREAMETLSRVCATMGDVEPRLRAGRATARGAETISGGWRYRLAWGGDEPPARHG